MNKIHCSISGRELGSYESAPCSDLKFVWLECNDWKTRITLSKQVVCDDKALVKMRDIVKKWKLNPCASMRWGKEDSIEEVTEAMNDGICYTCKKPFHDDSVMDGWKMYHKSCRGIFDHVKKVK